MSVMSKAPLNYEMPTEVRELAEKSVEQARKAFDGFLGAASKAMSAAETQASSVQTNTKDMTTKAMVYAERNVTAAFELAQKIVRSKDVQEIMQHQAEYLKSQAAAMQAQLKDFGEVVQANVQKAATETQAVMTKVAADAQDAIQTAQKAASDATTKRK
jgi:phasin